MKIKDMKDMENNSGNMKSRNASYKNICGNVIRVRRVIISLLLIIMAFALSGCVVVESSSGTETDNGGSTTSVNGALENGDSGLGHGGDIRPQDDYYGYVNKKLLDSLEVNYTTSMAGSVAWQQTQVEGEVLSMITGIAESSEEYAKGSCEQLVRDTYRQMLEFYTDGTGNAGGHFKNVADEIKSASDLSDIKAIIGRLVREEGIRSYFNIGAGYNYYDGQTYVLTVGQKREFAGFWLKSIYEQDKYRQELKAYAMNVLVATGEEVAKAREKADALVYFVIDISCATNFSVMDADNPYLEFKFKTDDEMREVLGNNAPADICSMYGIADTGGKWMFNDEGQLRCLSEFFCEDNVEVLKTWLLCDVMYEWRDFLRTDYVFLENYTENYGAEPGTAAAKATTNLLESQVSALYARYYYTDEMDRQINRMYEDIKESYRELITGAEWLTKDTRDSLIRKLDNMYFVKGTEGEDYADGYRADAGNADRGDDDIIGDNAFDTMRRANIRSLLDNVAKVGTMIDKSKSIMASYIINSAYSMCNTFTITVGIMHAPYFDVDADYAENLGGLGMVMAHEIGHAFDCNGIAYDENGAYNPDRICAEDREKLAVRLAQMEDYYSSYAIMDIYYVDGVLTSGENYADKGAMECLMNIVKTPEDREKLFHNYAYIWCMLLEDDYAISDLDEDEHSPHMIRVNAVLSSTREFYELYDVQPTDGMYVEPDKRVGRFY